MASKIKVGSDEVWISVPVETEATTTEVAQYPIEDGSNISDHVKTGQVTYPITGKIFDPEPLIGLDKHNFYNKLKKWQDKGTPVLWGGVMYVGRGLITNLTYTEGQYKNCIDVSFTLIPLKTAYLHWRKKESGGKKQPQQPSKQNETYVTVKAGNTYWGWWRKYGTPIDKLREWNKWPDRQIPIGARARVK